MAVLLSTSAGDIVIDLYTSECPIACENFLKLCTKKYYNSCLIYNVQQNYLMQSGDPTGTGKGGNSIMGVLSGRDMCFFRDEISANKKFDKVGYVGMAHTKGEKDSNRSQFFITLRAEDMQHITNQHTIFGEVAEGFDVLEKINHLFCDGDGRPYQDCRINHTYVLDDPFPHPNGLIIPHDSPIRDFPPEESIKRRIPYEDTVDGNFTADGRTAEEIEASIRQKEAKSRAIVLEMTGDIPDADVKPPEEVLFVCKLNPVTRDEDLELIFSRFGQIKSCNIIRDHKTGDSLNYAFIEFDTEAACIEAYNKMNNALIDDRRIKVDFSQSVSNLWNRFLQRPRGSKANQPISTRSTDESSKSGIYGPTGSGASVNNKHQSHRDVSGRDSDRHNQRVERDESNRSHIKSKYHTESRNGNEISENRERSDQGRGREDFRRRRDRETDRSRDRFRNYRDDSRDRDRNRGHRESKHDRDRGRRSRSRSRS